MRTRRQCGKQIRTMQYITQLLTARDEEFCPCPITFFCEDGRFDDLFELGPADRGHQVIGCVRSQCAELVNYGKVKDAVPLLEHVVRIREQTLAEDHPD